MEMIFKNGTIVTENETRKADLLIEGERITAIGSDLVHPTADVIDVEGMLILPGGVDIHTHFDLPMFGTVSSDNHYTGHKAAAFGGTTTVIDFVPHESNSMEADVSVWRAKADPKAAIDFGFHMNVSRWEPFIKEELCKLPGLGITSIKVFMAYNHRLRLGDLEIFQAMRLAREYGLLTMLHAEDGDMIELLTNEALQAGKRQTIWHAKTRPAWGAVEAALRGVSLAAQTGAPLYIVHMNTAGEVDMLQYGRQRQLPVMGETCPQYLFFTSDDLSRPDGQKWVCSPPLRTHGDQNRLWEGLATQTIQVLGTDHCPFFYNGRKAIQYEGEEIAIPGKELGDGDFTKIPNGLPGVGDRLPVMWTHGVRSGKLTPNQFVAQISTNPAKIFGLYPRKGTLSVGSDADILIWDPEMKVRYGVAYAQHRTDYNLYEGWELVGYPKQVFLRGSCIVDRGHWLGKAGMGRYVMRQEGIVL